MYVQTLIGHHPIVGRSIWPVSSALPEQGNAGVAVGPIEASTGIVSSMVESLTEFTQPTVRFSRDGTHNPP
jgi:hypothetical protein